MQRNEWIAKFNLEQQEEEDKRQREAAALKMEQLDEKFENDEFSDGSEQEQEQDDAERQISERVDGLAEYQQNLPLSRIKYNNFVKALKNTSASSLYKQATKELQQQLRHDPDWRNDEKSDFDIKNFFATSLLRKEND